MSNLVEITEGTTKFLVPESHSSNGPGKINGEVFFNEQMAFNRDISVMFLRALDKEMTVCDAMSASGSRAVRIANEVSKTKVTSNDINPAAYELIKRNIESNGLKNCEASNRNLHSLLAENSYDYVDIDPFGSPVPFLHSAIIGCRRNGILAITATDAAPLAGAHALKCMRRYESRPLRGVMCHETGLRILLGTIARNLAKFDRGMKPLLSFSMDHYFRAYVQVTEGAGNADDTLSKMIYMSFDPKTHERGISKFTDEKHKYGPFWGGNLFDRDIISNMSSEGMACPKKCDKYLSIWKDEIDESPFVYDMSELSSLTKCSTPRFETFIERMNERGRTSATHVSPTGFKTVLPLEEIIEVYRDCSP